MRNRMEHAMEIPEVVSNPLFFSILEGFWTKYSVLTIRRFPGGGLGVIVHRSSSSVLFFYDFFFPICSIFLDILVV